MLLLPLYITTLRLEQSVEAIPWALPSHSWWRDFKTQLDVNFNLSLLCVYEVCLWAQAAQLWRPDATLLEAALYFHIMWVLGIELRLPGLGSRCLYLMSHLTGPRNGI